MKHLFVLLSSIILLSGCGGGSGSADSNSNYAGPMELGTVYTVFTGDQVQKDSPNTTLSITHKDGENKSNIELVEGSATIIRQ